MFIEDVGRICHEANRALQIALKDPTIAVSAHWDEVSQEMRDSTVNGVVMILTQDLTAEQIHENWMAVKREQGWKHGPIKDEHLKTHPLMVPYSELSSEDKLKDKIFGAIVNAVKAATLEEGI